MRLPKLLSSFLNSGEVTIFTGKKKVLQVKLEDSKIDFNISSKEFFKDIIDSTGGGTAIHSKLTQLRTLARELKKEGLTINLSYQGDILIIIGSGAKPKFSHLLTRSDSLEIKNLGKLLELSV